MNMKIIAGVYGGRLIKAPDNKRTHPMGEMIRNAMFNSIGRSIDGTMVLDAFAGSGSVGLEALSRGAESVLFIEKDRDAQRTIEQNISSIGVQSRAKLVKAPVASWVNTYDGPEFDIIFADPPYHDTQFSTVTKLMGLLKVGALMVLSHPGRDECPTKPGVVVVDNRSYGDATLVFFRRDF